jgi:hypothetical protein
MKKKVSALVFCLAFTSCLVAQSVSQERKAGLFAYAGLGYKSSGFPGIGFWCTDNLELKVGLGGGTFTTSGFSSGLRINFFAKKRLFLSAELSFRRLFAGKIVTDWNRDTEYVEYYVGNNNAFIPQIGFNYRAFQDKKSALRQILLALNLNYMVPLNPIQLQYLSGTQGTPVSSAWFEKTIYRLYHEGIGFSITANFYFQRPIKSH